MNYEEPVLALKFNHDNHVMVDSTRGTMDLPFIASTVDPIGLGVGDTPRKAVLSLCDSLRETADEIERLLDK